MESKRDLGFFNGMKAELIPLLAGLVSFTLVAEEAINQIENIFHSQKSTGIVVFILMYFIMPVIGILFWLTVMNYRDGLKRKMLANKRATDFRLICLILLAFIILIGTFWWRIKGFFVVALVTLVLLLVYFFRLIRMKEEFVPFHREYLQAKIQLGLLTSTLLILWVVYFYGYLTSNEFKDWKDDSKILTSIRTAATAREKYEDKSVAAKDFIDRYADLIYLPLQSSNAQLPSRDQGRQGLDALYKRIWDNPFATGVHETLAIDGNYGRENLDRIQYSVYRAQIISLDRYKKDWVPWMQIVQFKGLILFNLLLLFLLCVWYHSYHSQLDGNHDEDHSEITISKTGIYILFLIIIPFFKPITKENISFGKPYVTFSNPITINNKISGDKPNPPVEPINYDQFKSIVDQAVAAQLKETNESVKNVQETLKSMKQRPVKQNMQ
ncbi:MAG: hypothetical protein JNL17_09950 [Cyclobacteriaceae bacterium]|nr:hypothetical protein [Cyclobacteriaceae bacterium]